jgi:hypothetical protein
MNLVKCSKGHYYDGDKYQVCPHCGQNTSAGDSVTVAISTNAGGTDKTMAFSEDPVSAGQDAGVTASFAASPVDSEPVTQKSAVMDTSVESLQNSVFQDVVDNAQKYDFKTPDDDSKTVSYYDQKIKVPVSKEPVVGWLVCTSGKYFGQSFQLKSGRNFIGRTSEMDVALEGEQTVSRNRHAVIIYEPKERMFIAQPGDSRELFYINDEVVLDNTVLKPYDVINLGKVNLLMIPFCSKEFAWEDLKNEGEEDK